MPDQLRLSDGAAVGHLPTFLLGGRVFGLSQLGLGARVRVRESDADGEAVVEQHSDTTRRQGLNKNCLEQLT